MSQTKRAQIMMEPDDYERLQSLASARGTSVAELIRIAVHDRWLTRSRRNEAAAAILGIRVDEDFGSPEDLAREVADRYVDVH